MSAHFKPWETATEYGVWYMFDNIGEGIPMHVHMIPSLWHDTRCLKGSCAIYGDDVDVILRAGETLKFKSYRMHELEALEAGTEIVNVFIHGKPEDHVGVDSQTLSGNIAVTLRGRIKFP